jgi:hypothetical protein
LAPAACGAAAISCQSARGLHPSFCLNFIGFHFAGDHLMRGLGPQRLEQPLDDRVLRWAELRAGPGNLHAVTN